jgi:hypothetical protein
MRATVWHRRALGRGAALVSALAALVCTSSVHAETQTGFTAKLLCHSEANFVLCMVQIDVDPRAHITYAEARLLSAPSFLKQVGRSPRFEDSMQRLPNLKLGFVVNGGGTGQVVVEARAVVCQDNPVCPHVSKVVSAVVSAPKKKN